MTLGTAAGAALAGLILFWAAGWGLTPFLPGLQRATPFHRLGYQYILGLAWSSAGAWAASHLLGLTLRRGVLLPIALFPIVVGTCLRLRRRVGRRPTFRPPRTGLDRALATAALVVGAGIGAGLFADAVTGTIRDFDGTMTWSATARWIRAAGTVDAPVLTDDRFYVTHPRYPILLPLAQVVVHEIFDTGGDDRAVRALYAAFYPALLLILADAATRLAGRRAAQLTVLVVALLPLLAFWKSDYGGADSTYGDVPLACYWGAGLVHLLRPGFPSIGAGVFLGAVVLTKQEGLPLAAIALFAGLLAALRHPCGARPSPRGRIRHAAFRTAGALAPVVLAAALLVSWQRRIPDRFTATYAIPTPGALIGKVVERVPFLPRPMWSEMSDPNVWGGFWILAPLVAVLGARGFRRKPAAPLAVAILLAVALYVLAYSVSTWTGGDQVHPTWNRFLLHLTVPGSLLLAIALRQILGAAPSADRPE